MTRLEPTDVKNLDRYGSPALEWSRARDLLDDSATAATDDGPVGPTFWLATSSPDGRPHVTGIGALWVDDQVWFTSGPGTRKSRNLEANPACVFTVSLPGLDLSVEGTAVRVTDSATLERLARLYRDQGWPAEVEGDALTAPFSASSAGPPPWQLFVVAPETIFAVATAEPNGATRWRFPR